MAASLSPISPGPRTGGAGRRPGTRRAGDARAGDPLALHAVLWLVAAGLAAFTIRRPISPHDEGLMLQAGARIVAGQWPYRDFWTNYPPGQASLLAGLDELFGVSMLAWRIVWVACAASASGLSFALVRRVTAGRRGGRGGLTLALVTWLAVAGAMAWPSTPDPDPAAFTLALAALLAAPRRALLAGALAGLASFFRLEIGAAAVLGVLVLCETAPERIRALGAAIAVAAATLGPFLAAAPDAMVHDTLGFYAIAPDAHLPLPIDYPGPLKPDKLLEFYDPLVLLAAAALGALSLARGALAGRASRLAVALVPLAIVGVLYLLARTDEFHVLPLSAVLAVALAAQLADDAVSGVWLWTALVTAVVVIALAGLDRRGGQVLHPPAAAAAPGPAGDGVQTSPADARSLRRLIVAVHRLVPPGRPIFVADPRFDVVRVGDPLLYITLGRPNPTAYDVMQPGLVTTATVQRRIIASLRASDTTVIVRWLNPTAEPRPLPAHPAGAHLLDRWIAAHFRPDLTDGDYGVLTRRGGRYRRPAGGART